MAGAKRPTADSSTIIAYLQNHEGSTARDISNALKLNSSQRTAHTLTRMAQEHKIHQTRGKYGYIYYTASDKVPEKISRDNEILQIAEQICKQRGYVRSKDIMYEMQNRGLPLPTKKIARVLRDSGKYEKDTAYTTTTYNAYKLAGSGHDRK